MTDHVNFSELTGIREMMNNLVLAAYMSIDLCHLEPRSYLIVLLRS